MRKACLLYNPVSGGRRSRRRAELNAALSVLHSAGVEAELVAIRSPQDAAQQARQAIAQGCDTVFACGGDGTIHDILQGLAGTSAALGVLPMGTANALAHDLGMPLNTGLHCTRSVGELLWAASRILIQTANLVRTISPSPRASALTPTCSTN